MTSRILQKVGIHTTKTVGDAAAVEGLGDLLQWVTSRHRSIFKKLSSNSGEIVSIAELFYKTTE